MGSGFEINVSDQASQIGQLLAGMEKHMDAASDRALRKTAKWLATHSVREIGRELQIKQQPVKRRFQVYPNRRGQEVKLWVGLYPIAVHHLGTPKQTPDGVKVGRRRYGGAFLAPANNSPETVWRRRGRERLPIDRVTEDIAEPVQSVLARWERRTTARFAEIFEQEVRFELSKITA